MIERLSKYVAVSGSGEDRRIIVFCPACEDIHCLSTRWTWNGDVNRPTFAPSIKVTLSWGEDHVMHRCHSWLRNGEWTYCRDSTHALAGGTAPLAPLPPWIGAEG